MRHCIAFIALVATFLPVKVSLAQESGIQAQEGVGFKEALSYTQDYTWFAKKDWQNGMSEVKQSRQSQPWRMGSWEERVQYFISRLQKGDQKAFLYVNYGLLDGYGNPYTHRSAKGYPTEAGKELSRGVLWYLLAKAQKLNVSFEQALTGGNPKTREQVVKAVLPGLFNKDPRVRLVAINLLRRLRPDKSMMKDVKRAMALETVTTERSKWREKDIDIPSIEQPRLGWDAVAWNGSMTDGVDTSIRELWYDGSSRGEAEVLNGNGKGRYLTEGIYRQGFMNYYSGVVTKMNYADPQEAVVSADVWLKSPLLRYGADAHVSDFETRYGLKEKESMLRYAYLYSDSLDPKTQLLGENLYYAYHSVWEELKKLELFVIRATWVEKIKQGDVGALRMLSKDSFRALADQIDGESLENVPMKSKSFKIFGEAEVRAVIVGMLENRVVSTREECIHFLKRLFDEPDVSMPVKREIKKALREARRRELIIDTIRGRHVHALLTVTQKPDDWWAEEDEVDTSVWRDQNGRMLQQYRNQIEFPEESDIIYHDRRKPGQEEDEVVQPQESGTPKMQPMQSEGALNRSVESRFYGHPLLVQAYKTGRLTAEDIEKYLQLSVFLAGGRLLEDGGQVASSSMASGQLSLVSRSLPGQDHEGSARSVATRYEIVRAVEALHSLLLGNEADLLKVSYLDLQNALLILHWVILKDTQSFKENNYERLLGVNFLEYFIAGSIGVSSQGRRLHGRDDLAAELKRVERARGNLQTLLGKIKSYIHQAHGKGQIRMNSTGLSVAQLKELREHYYKNMPEMLKQESQVPGRSYIDSELGVSHRGEAEKSHGKFYGHGHGGYYNFYDQQVELAEAQDDMYKNELGFYQLPAHWKQTRSQIVQALLASLADKDPQKRLIVVHLLRRLVPDASMLPRVNKLIREIETIDKRPYTFFDTVLNKDIYKCDQNGVAVKNENPVPYFSVQEKIVGHELLKMQRFIVRRILVNKVRNGQEKTFLKEIPKGSFLTLVLRIDAEWDPFRVPLKTVLARNQDGSNGMFFTAKDIDVIRGGLENSNFIVQREAARWIVSFLNHNYGTVNLPPSELKKFVRAIKFAERRDIVYYERNYVKWEYTDDFSRTQYISGDPKFQVVNVTGVPLGRIPVRVGSAADAVIFGKIDMDRKLEFENDYGRVEDKGEFQQFDEPGVPLNELQGKGGSVRKAYRYNREERERRKRELGDEKARDEGVIGEGAEESYQQQGLDFKAQ